jgi:hypothetical protein
MTRRPDSDVKRIMPTNKYSKRLIFAAAMMAILVLLAASVFCQSPDSSLTGVVKDKTKMVVVDAIVSVKNTNTNVEVMRSTDESGRYVFLGLQPGQYTVTVEAQHFKKFVKDIEISPAGQEVLNVSLESAPSERPVIYANEDSFRDGMEPHIIWPDPRLEELKIQAEKNKKEGDAFLLANKTKKGVTVIPNSRGVQYKVITKGNGPKPAETDTVQVGFILSLIDGKELKEISNSYKGNLSISWQVGQMIPGMKTVLLNMPVGSKWEVVIPPEQAYGEKGTGPIKPYSTLIFTIELVGIKK